MRNDPPDDDQKNGSLDQRLGALKARLGETTPQSDADDEGEEGASRKQPANIAQAFRLSSEFIAGIVVGAGIGYAIDQLFGTTPWAMILFLILGFAAAILNVMRSSGLIAESGMRIRPAKELSEAAEKDNNSGRDEKE